MSRIGKREIVVPGNVELKIEQGRVNVKGPKGKLEVALHPKIEVAQDGATLTLSRVDDSREAREQHGLRRTLLANAVTGVSDGFSKSLEVNGVGYRVNLKGKDLELSVGYSHPVLMKLPDGVEATVEGNKISLTGFDKQLLGEFAAQVRRVRLPEPYKGKGIKYITEQIRRKAGKSGGK